MLSLSSVMPFLTIYYNIQPVLTDYTIGFFPVAKFLCSQLTNK